MMLDYHFNEGAFRIPGAGVIDRSTTALEVPVGEKRISVVVGRQPRGDKNVRAILEESVRAMSVSFRRFRAEKASFFDLRGFDAVRLALRWRHQTTPMYNQVAIVALDELALTITVAGEEGLRDEVESLFTAVLASFKARKR